MYRVHLYSSHFLRLRLGSVGCPRTVPERADNGTSQRGALCASRTRVAQTGKRATTVMTAPVFDLACYHTRVSAEHSEERRLTLAEQLTEASRATRCRPTTHTQKGAGGGSGGNSWRHPITCNITL